MKIFSGSRLILLLFLLMMCCFSQAVSAQEVESFEPDIHPFADYEEREALPEVLVKGKVIEIIEESEILDPISLKPITSQTLKVRLTSGEFKGREISIQHNETDNLVFNIKVKPGDGVIVLLVVEESRIQAAFIADHLRVNYQYILGIIFIILLLAIGWKKGAKTLCALILTLVLIGGVLLPGLLKGYSPVLLSTGIAILATALTTLIVGGWTLKSLAAILGTGGGVAIAGFLALVSGKAAHLTGFGAEEAAMLLYLPENISLDIQGILFAGIIISALGACMDVSMSIASSIEEVKRTDPYLKASSLIRSGMNVGRDIMGTMANTLILVYTGSSLQLMLVFMAFKEPLLKIINLDMVASEVVRALSGSIGMITVIPLTAIIAGTFFGRNTSKAVQDNMG